MRAEGKSKAQTLGELEVHARKYMLVRVLLINRPGYFTTTLVVSCWLAESCHGLATVLGVDTHLRCNFYSKRTCYKC